VLAEVLSRGNMVVRCPLMNGPLTAPARRGAVGEVPDA